MVFGDFLHAIEIVYDESADTSSGLRWDRCKDLLPAGFAFVAQAKYGIEENRCFSPARLNSHQMQDPAPFSEAEPKTVGQQDERTGG